MPSITFTHRLGSRFLKTPRSSRDSPAARAIAASSRRSRGAARQNELLRVEHFVCDDSVQGRAVWSSPSGPTDPVTPAKPEPEPGGHPKSGRREEHDDWTPPTTPGDGGGEVIKGDESTRGHPDPCCSLIELAGSPGPPPTRPSPHLAKCPSTKEIADIADLVRAGIDAQAKRTSRRAR